MLIACPECNREISDKAIACPGCGYPINPSQVDLQGLKSANTGVTRAKRGRMRLPNGFGSIKYLGKNRRKPYVAYPTVPKEQYTDDGKRPNVSAIGYFESWSDAYQCLCAYNEHKGAYISFKKVYELWSEEKFNDPIRPVSKQTIKNYKWAYNLSEDLWDISITMLRKSDMQKVINNNLDKSSGCLNSLKNLYGQLFKYAIQEGICTTDYSTFVTLKPSDAPKGQPLTQTELDALWRHKDNKYVQIALIYAYTGLRRTELKVVDIDLKNKLIRGGIKTTAGKDRVIPISPLILPFLRDFDQENFSPNNYADEQFKEVKRVCEFDNERKIVVHSLRHTFSWLCDVYGVDEMSKHLIMGHSLGRDVEKNTYGHRTVEQLKQEVAKIQYFEEH